MQLYVQKSISTTFPASSCSWIVNGSELYQGPSFMTSYCGTIRGPSGVGSGVGSASPSGSVPV